jgi:putative SOS response-associated peptidase YedK
MCGRFALATDLDQIALRFSFAPEKLLYGPRYNVAPSQEVLTVVNGEGRLAELMLWGLIPPWAKEAAVGYRLINARAETVAEKSTFRGAFQKRRCLILADGFYEWRRNGKQKTPMFIALKSREPFAFAGLWEFWNSPSGEAIHSCTIITTIPNALMETIHDRMPVILPREAEPVWLDTGIEDPGTLSHLLAPYPAAEMQAYAVHPMVNSPRNDNPACIVPARS